MTTNTNLSEFSDKGINLGKDERLMTYLYGLSDFWTFVFEDSSKINVLLEAQTLSASEIYSNFLQNVTQISLADVQATFNNQITLVALGSDDAVNGKVETYKLPQNITYSRFIANRPLLPTTNLYNEVDYFIDENTSEISFAKPLSDLGFPSRFLANGSKQYALWFVDAQISADLVYDYFAKLVDIAKPEASTEAFKTFVNSLYYLYVNGPNLDLIRKGLNLSLGIPFARDNELVLDIRTEPNTNLFVIVTDTNSYLIPYGLPPSVEVGQTLTVGSELAAWIRVKDYESDGKWWINLMLPANLLPNVPSGYPETSRYMTNGSYGDYLMINYLRHHTFLIEITTVNFKNIQTFESVYDIVRRVKPSYTTPIYVWVVPIPEDVMGLDDSDLTFALISKICTPLTDIAAKFIRDYNSFAVTSITSTGNTATVTTTTPHNFITGVLVTISGASIAGYNGTFLCAVTSSTTFAYTIVGPLGTPSGTMICCGYNVFRGCPSMTRGSGPALWDDTLGLNPDMNGFSRGMNSGVVTGYIAPQFTYRSITDTHPSTLRELSLLRTFRTRNQNQYMARRGKVDFAMRNMNTPAFDQVGQDPIVSLFPDYRMVYLYTTINEDVNNKFAFAHKTVPGLSTYVFTLFRPESLPDTELIDGQAIDAAPQINYYDFLVANFDYYFVRGAMYQSLEDQFPRDSYVQYKPLVEDLVKEDFLVFVRVTPASIGVFWATTNMYWNSEPYHRHLPNDSVKIQITVPLGQPNSCARSMAPLGSPRFLLRNSVGLSDSSVLAVDGTTIDGSTDTSDSHELLYSDAYNTNFVCDRGNQTDFTISKDWN